MVAALDGADPLARQRRRRHLAGRRLLGADEDRGDSIIRIGECDPLLAPFRDLQRGHDRIVFPVHAAPG